MSSVAIAAEDLGKRYKVGTREQYGALRDNFASALKAPFRALAQPFGRGPTSTVESADDHIWSLRDVSFEVRSGEAVGLIGRNGAGKSTLLKVLSRITEPTVGRVRVSGRVGSLLEVGSGFHPELTGRENIYLNGAILGMSKLDIARRFDEIVAFAEVERFLDTPVKRYSSGMYVRLAFAVAAHLEPEILLVDEVLAVGDAAFQKKCLGRMNDAAREGRTVVFVSHNMPVIEKLCERVFVLEQGRVALEGDPIECIKYYLASGTLEHGTGDLRSVPRLDAKLRPTITALEILDAAGTPTTAVGSGEALEFHISYETDAEIFDPSFGVIISTSMGANLIHLQTRAHYGLIDRLGKQGKLVCRVPQLPLIPGRYMLTVGCSSNDRQLDLLEHVASLTVEPRDFFNTGYLPHHTNGSVLVPAAWEIQSQEVQAVAA